MNSKEFEYLGIKKWHEAGYRGQGITIASREDEKTAHGAKVADILRQVCPEARILTGIKYYNEIPDNLDGYTTSLDDSFSDKEYRVQKQKKCMKKTFL